jgi:hypothetical protein
MPLALALDEPSRTALRASLHISLREIGAPAKNIPRVARIPRPPAPALSNVYIPPSTVSVTHGALNVNIQGLPPANDYFVLFMNATGGVTYSISSKFTISASKDAANGQSIPNKPTASVVGPPNPTETWALAFNSNGAAIGAAAPRSPVPGTQWWIGALALLGAGVVSLL